MKISHYSKRKMAVVCLLLIAALVVSSNAYASEEKGFLVRMWERITGKDSQESVAVGKAPEQREVKPSAKMPEKAADEPKEEQKGFFARMWDNITKRFARKPEEAVPSSGEPAPSKPVPVVIEEEEEKVMYDTPASKLSKSEILGKIEKKLGDKPYLINSVQGLSYKKSVMDGRMYYYYSPVNGIPEKIMDLDKNVLLALMTIIDSEELRLGDVEMMSEGSPQMMPTEGVPSEGAAPYQPGMPGESPQAPAPQVGAPASPAAPAGPAGMPGEAGEEMPDQEPGPASPSAQGAPGAQAPSAPPAPKAPAPEQESPEVEPPVEEEEDEREIPHTKEEMLDVIYKRLKVFGEIEYIIPNLFSRETPDGKKEYYYVPDGGVALKLRDLDKGDLFDLYVRVNNEATRINTERILRQIQQQEQIMRQIQLQQMQMQQMQQPPQPPPQPPRTPQVYNPPQPPRQHQVPTPPPAPPQTRQ